MPALGAAGGLTRIIALPTPRLRCHVVDPHGRGYVPTRALARLKVIDAGNAEVAPVADGGMVDLADGQRLGRSAADDTADVAARAGTPLHWGFAYNATLARASLAPPGSSTLATQFFRIVAVDLDWHLLGNRGGSAVAGIPGDDKAVPDFALPRVRPSVPNFDYLIDSMDVLGAAGQIASGFPTSSTGSLALVCSAEIDPALAVPGSPGAAGHWPAFPGPNPGGLLAPTADATQGIAAAFRAPADGTNARLDVVATIAADRVPDGTHLRVFPRSFVPIAAIDAAQQSFVRADGGSTIARAGQASVVLLLNPFGLAPEAPLPAPRSCSSTWW